MFSVIRWALNKIQRKKHLPHIYQQEEKMFGVIEECPRRNSKDAWPEPRSGHRMCADDNYLYVFGGYDPKKDNRLYNELWRYNITTEKWVKLPDDENLIPKECLSSTMLLWQHKIIIFGGTGYPFAETNSNKLYLYCLKTCQWVDLNDTQNGESESKEKDCDNYSKHTAVCSCDTKITSSEPPAPKYGHGMALCERNGELYIFSGTKGRTFEDELHKFNLDGLTWDLVEFCEKHDKEIPGPRYRHEVVWNDKEFYIFGGSTLDEMFENDIVYSFDFDEYTWKRHTCSTNVSVAMHDGRELLLYPEPRKAHTCVLYNDVVYMVGGINENDDDEELFSDIWRFCLKDKMWSKWDQVEFPREVYFHSSAVTTQGCMYVFGGADAVGRRNNYMYKMWVCAPSLKEQAWLKVVNILKNKNKLKKEVLEQLGVPNNFYCRLDDDHRLIQAA